MRVLVLICILCFFFSCSKNPELEKKQIIQNAKQSSFEFIEKITPDSASVFRRFTVYKNKIYAFDYESVISVFNRKGELEHSFGGKGEGPGEFKFLTGIVILDDILYAADTEKKITTFSLQGEVLEQYKTEYRIDKIYIDGIHVYYLGLEYRRDNTDKKIHYYMKLIRVKDNKEVLTYKNNTQVFALHPSGKDMPLPWFPAPYPDRKFFLSCRKGELLKLSAQSADILKRADKDFKKTDSGLSLPCKEITEKDRNAFFTYMNKVNKTRYPASTRNSVRFPEHKEYFLGAIEWGGNIALINLGCLHIITPEGKLIKTLKLPSSLLPDNYWDFIFPERLIVFHNKEVFIFNEEEEEIFVYKEKS